MGDQESGAKREAPEELRAKTVGDEGLPAKRVEQEESPARRVEQEESRAKRFMEVFAESGRELSTATIAFHGAVAERLGLHITDHKALGILHEHGPMPAGRLGELTGLTTGSVTALIDRLEAAGYVSRERDPDDRRKVIVAPALDDARLREIQGLFGHLVRAFAKHLPEYSDEEAQLIVDFTRRSVAALREATASLRTET